MNFSNQVKAYSRSTVLLAKGARVPSTQGTNSFNNLTAVGSGFCIHQDGWVITSNHVVNHPRNPFKDNEVIFAFQKTSETEGKFALATGISYAFPEIDICLIKFDHSFNPVPLNNHVPSQGEEIGVFGYPASNIIIEPNGQINGSQIRPRVAKTVIGSREVHGLLNFDGGAISIVNKRFIEAQFTFIKGNSGGPVFSAKTGKVVGVVTGSVHLPQDIMHVQNMLGATQNLIPAVPFATYALAIGIDEILKLIPKRLYSLHW